MLQIKLLHPDAKVPTRANATDAGLDLYALGMLDLMPCDFASVPTGIAVSMPTGYYGRIAPRSGLALRNGIDVLGGTVDSDYRGEVRVILINHGTGRVVIHPGDRIAQLVIQKVELWNPVVVDELDETARGDNGFGSTERLGK